jgi:PKD repeat protein
MIMVSARRWSGWAWPGVVLAMLVACAVHQDDPPPPLTGPSTFAQSISITASPDLLVQDGQSRSQITVRAFDANGQPLGAVPLRLDMLVNGTPVDYGTLASKNLVTTGDGRASTVYTAPAPAPPTAPTTTTVTVQATIIGTTGPGSVPFSTAIRLVAPGVILPPAETPTAVFSVSPSTPAANTPVQFNASASCGGPLASASAPCQSTSQITSYRWDFGDGAGGSGQTTSHVFAVPGTFNVTLTVTNDRGISASTTQAVTVGASAAPVAKFVVSPGDPTTMDEIFFNASESTAGPGHTLVSYHWVFGDGDDAVGQIRSHRYKKANMFDVTLTVTDEVGQSNTSSLLLTVN